MSGIKQDWYGLGEFGLRQSHRVRGANRLACRARHFSPVAVPPGEISGHSSEAAVV
jgi:hypothetical protein